MSDTQILIVEDEGIVAEDISESLRRLGYGENTIVDTGEKAVEISAQIHPRLILMDIKLKGAMDGIEAAREIRQRFHVPIVYLSASADPKTIERAKFTEPFGYLLKPYNPEELRSTIEMALFKHKMELPKENRHHAEKMQAVGTLAGGVAHSFNNLLTAILGYSNLILSDCNDDVLSERLGAIVSASERAAALTRDLLTFSRKQVFQPEVFDLRSLVQDMHGPLLRLIGVDVELKIKLGADPAMIHADRGQLGQVLINLAGNAREAMPGGGLLTLEVENVTLTESLIRGSVILPPGSYVVITVTDSGCGMDESVLAHIYEPFFTTKEPGKGTGLGLSMVYGIVQQSHGQICVQSALGAGSTFWLYFPREQRRPAPASPQISSADVFQPGGETILLVEDEPGLRKMISGILSKEGYSILEAADGLEALRISEQHFGPIQLLLTDVMTPRMGGAQLAEQLGSLRPDTRVLFISGYTAGMIEDEGKLHPEVEFLQKPFTPRALAAKVRAVLRPPHTLRTRTAGR